MTEVFLDFSQPLEAVSRHIHTVAVEPEWSSSVTSKPAVNTRFKASSTHLSSSAFCRNICLY